MRAIILAESSQCDLSPLTDQIPHALLPLAGKSILVHALESLHRSSIRDVEVVAPTLHDELEAAFDKGTEMGMNIRFVPRMLDLRHLPEHCLIIGLQNLFDINWDKVLDKFGELMCHALLPIKMMAGDEPAAMLIPPHFDGKVSCDWSGIYHTEAIQVPISPNHRVRTSSIPLYHRASFHLLRYDYKYMKPAGRSFASGHFAAPGAYVNERSLKSSHGYFGSNSIVDKSASLCGSVILGDNVVVDKGARVSDSIIFDSTYIGINTDYTNSIVSGNLMIKVDTGICLKLDDLTLFGAIA